MRFQHIFPFASVFALVASIRLFITVNFEVLLESAGTNYLVADVASYLVHLQVDCVQVFSQIACTAKPLLTSMTLVFGI